MKKFLTFVLLTLATFFTATAQEMTVKSMSLTNDPTANLSENLIQDNNGDYAGLVKVMLAAANAHFEGLVLRQQVQNLSEYWVFMAKGSYKLKVVAPGYLPLDINFRDHGIEGIESRRTYVLTITLPQTGVVLQDDGMRYLAITVEPKNSTVLVDGNLQVVDENGEVSVLLPKGSHRYQVMAPGYATKEGMVEVGDDNKPFSVRLVSTLATLRVECATKGAQVFVNNQLRGTAPWSGSLASGSYLVEVRMDGYQPQKQTITLAQNDNKAVTIPELQRVSGRINIDYRPLGSEVFIDGKKVGTTPNVFRDIPVGNRSVEIRKEGYETIRKSVAVRENEQTTLTGSLTVLASSSTSGNAGISSSSTSSSKETFTVNGVSFTMVRVEGGTFTMGATKEQVNDANNDENPAHKVTLSSFSIGETEVTQALWQAVMGNNPSKFTESPQNPVENISWEDCVAFFNKLNQLTKKKFRFPTEAEWEYAARGGSKSKHYKYSGSNTVGDVAWYIDNSGSKPHPVKGKAPNKLGLYDMSGNVWEWCADWKDRYSDSSQNNPKGPKKGSIRILRGGCWSSGHGFCRVSRRSSSTPDIRDFDLGLRLAL